MEAIESIEKLYERKGGITGISTGFVEFDRMTSGLHSSEMVVIAARPSMGKTALAMNIAEHVAKRPSQRGTHRNPGHTSPSTSQQAQPRATHHSPGPTPQRHRSQALRARRFSNNPCDSLKALFSVEESHPSGDGGVFLRRHLVLRDLFKSSLSSRGLLFSESGKLHHPAACEAWGRRQPDRGTSWKYPRIAYLASRRILILSVPLALIQ